MTPKVVRQKLQYTMKQQKMQIVMLTLKLNLTRVLSEELSEKF